MFGISARINGDKEFGMEEQIAGSFVEEGLLKMCTISEPLSANLSSL